MSGPARPASGRAAALDWLGVGASLTCAIHCAIAPVLLVALPALGASWLLSDPFARVMIAGLATVALLSLPRGFRRHASAGPQILAGLGIACLLAGEVFQGDSVRGLVLGLSGGLLVAGAHLLNRALCLACPACSVGNPAQAGACRREES